MDMVVAARAGRSVPVVFADDVSAPEPNGPYVTIRLYRCGLLVAMVSFTTEQFYAALDKVMESALPATGDTLTH